VGEKPPILPKKNRWHYKHKGFVWVSFSQSQKNRGFGTHRASIARPLAGWEIIQEAGAAQRGKIPTSQAF